VPLDEVDTGDRPARGEVLRRCWTNPRIRWLLAAYLLFNVAEWASWIALLVWAYDIGGVRGASALALVQLVPAALAAPALASLLARLRGPRALLAGYAAQAAGALAVGTTIFLDGHVVVVAAIAIGYSCAFTCTRPVHHSLLPEVSRTTEELTAGNAGSGWVEAVATFVGPLACGALITWWGPAGVVLVMGAGACVGVVLTLALGPGVPRIAGNRAAGDRSALRIVWTDPAARLLCGLVAAEYVLVGMMDILLVVLALDLLEMSHAGPGVLNSAIGVGGLVGASATVVLIGARGLSRFVVAGAVVGGAPFALAGMTEGVVLAMVLVATCGAGKAFFDVASRTFVQRLLPDTRLAAVYGVQEAMMMAGLAGGSLAAPVLVAVVGPSATFLVAGAFLPVVTLAVWRRLRRLDEAATVPPDTLALISQVPMLAVLAPRVVERLAVFSGAEACPAGAAVVTEGESGELFYVVGSGTVVVSHGDDVIRTLGPGGWFGELALLDPASRRTATVTAVGPVELVTIDRHTFLTALSGRASSRMLADEHAREHYR
jgi:hypothetical protein